MMKKIAVILLIMTLLLVLAGCKSEKPAEQDPEKAKDTIVILVDSEPRNLDPIVIESEVQAFVLRFICENLFVVEPDGSVSSDILETYSVYGTTFQGTLKEGILYSNGSEMTAKDVLWKLQRLSEAEELDGPLKYLNLDESFYEDDYNFTLEFTQAWGSFEYAFAEVEGGVVCGDACEEQGLEAFAEAPIGTGPYKVEHWEPEKEILLTANENYHGEKPKTPNILIKFVPDSNERLNALRSGAADMDFAVLSGYAGMVDSIDGVSGVSGNSYDFLSLVFNPETTLFSVKDVRSALCMAIDRDELAAALGRGAGNPINGYFSPFVPGYTELEPWEGDLDKAKTLLTEVVSGGDMKIEICVPEGEEYLAVAEKLKEQWRKLRVSCEIVTYYPSQPMNAESEETAGTAEDAPEGAPKETPRVFLVKGAGGEMSDALRTYRPYVDEGLNAMILDLNTYYRDDSRGAQVAKEITDALRNESLVYPVAVMQRVYGVSDKLSGFSFYPSMEYIDDMEYWIANQ